jgi:hypothetical protein
MAGVFDLAALFRNIVQGMVNPEILLRENRADRSISILGIKIQVISLLELEIGGPVIVQGNLIGCNGQEILISQIIMGHQNFVLCVSHDGIAHITKYLLNLLRGILSI